MKFLNFIKNLLFGKKKETVKAEVTTPVVESPVIKDVRVKKSPSKKPKESTEVKPKSRAKKKND